MVKENCTSDRIWESNEFAKFRLFFRLQRVRQNTEPEFGQCTSKQFNVTIRTRIIVLLTAIG